MITGAAAAPIGRNLQSGGVVAGAFPPTPGFGPKPYDHPRRGTGLVAHPVFKTGRAGQPPAWKVRFLRRVVAGNGRFWHLRADPDTVPDFRACPQYVPRLAYDLSPCSGSRDTCSGSSASAVRSGTRSTGC